MTLIALPETHEPGRHIDTPAAERAAADLLAALGADLADEGLRETPRRMAAAYAELLTPQPFRPTTFPNDEGYDELVVARSIPFHSLCMHHLLPFHGVAHIGYLPGERILGLSKFARVVELFARDLQIQERLTVQIASWLQEHLAPKGVGVVLEAEHMCMSLRGVQKFGAQTVTSALHGVVRDDPRTRQEFLALTTRTDHALNRRRSPSWEPASPAPRPPRPCARRASTAASCCSGAEAERPYERPPLSKDYLRGESERDGAYVHGAGFYAEHEIELRAGASGDRARRERRELELEGGERLGYDRLLLATGAEPRRLCIPGAELDGVHLLRTFADSDALRERLDAGGRLVVVGAGWIGSEVAASARQRGMEVTVVAPEAVPLERVLGLEVGGIYRDLHRDHGVELRMEAGVASFEGEGRVERVTLQDGAPIACDAVVVGVGAAPRTGLAEAAGLAVENGVLVDGRLETSVSGIFAAGDVANHLHPVLGRLRVEHWDNALHQGPAAARAMLGADEPYARTPYFFSDQYDVGMEYSGFATSWDRVVFRGDPASRELIAFWLAGDRVVAGMNVNVWDVAETIGALIGHPADARRLADPDVPLGELVAAAREAAS